MSAVAEREYGVLQLSRHGHVGQQPQFFEVTREKKVVWQFEDHAHFKTINQVPVLVVPGDVTKGEALR